MKQALGFLVAQPFILLFLVVAAGYAIGRLRFRGLTLGATAATLIVALSLSLFASAAAGVRFAISDVVGTVFFNMFMFSVGMKVGPQFLTGLRRDAKQYIVLGVVTPLLAVGLTLLLRWVLHLDPGMTVGVLGGANTATPGLGAAQDAIASGAARLPPGASKDAVTGSLSTAFAFSYCLSTLGFVVMMKIVPRVFRRDVVRDAAAFEKQVAAEATAPLPGSAEAFVMQSIPADVRVYRVETDAITGETVGALMKRFPRMSIERIRRDGRLITPGEDARVQRGDLVAIAGNTQRLIEDLPGNLGPEVADPELRDVGREMADLVVRNPSVVGKTLLDLARDVGHGLALTAMFRAGEDVRPTLDTVVSKGDVLRVTGSKRRIESLGKSIGAVVRPSLATDIVTLAAGLCVGAFVGALAIPIAGIRFSLGSAVGLLLAGIALSIFRTRNPALGGPYPEPARQLIEDLGLNVFIAVLGINSGPSILAVLKGGEIGGVLLACLIIGFVPPIIAWAIGQFRFKMNSAILMGAVAGARCNSAGMRASQEAAHSPVPAVSYPVTFALSNIVLTLACYLFALFIP